MHSKLQKVPYTSKELSLYRIGKPKNGVSKR